MCARHSAGEGACVRTEPLMVEAPAASETGQEVWYGTKQVLARCWTGALPCSGKAHRHDDTSWFGLVAVRAY